MSNYVKQDGIERYCPVCDALEIYVKLLNHQNKDGSTSVDCEKCGYQRHYSKEEVKSLAEQIA